VSGISSLIPAVNNVIKQHESEATGLPLAWQMKNNDRHCVQCECRVSPKVSTLYMDSSTASHSRGAGPKASKVTKLPGLVPRLAKRNIT
jgi:hypothetical protein